MGSVIWTDHFSYDSMNYRNYSSQDIDFILQEGTVKEPPEYDEDYRNWKYKVEGKTIDGDIAIVITVILSYRELLAITIMPKKEI
ncbi:MAG: DUF4258 domain-containing protein [Deltaproteobacteria bacterium]|nr:DUF4258 domain-containing protein [Deltaproteobacteria bacterium]